MLTQRPTSWYQPAAMAADKIVIGVTTSLNFLEGKEANNCGEDGG